MYVWEAQLKVRMCAVQFKLMSFRSQWINKNHTLENLFPSSDSYARISEQIRHLEDQISLLQAEEKFIESLWNVGPIVGDKIALVVRVNDRGDKIDVPQSRSIIQLIEDWAEQEEDPRVREGMLKAHSIVTNPYRWLSEAEQKQYDSVDLEPKVSVQVAPNKILSDDDGETVDRQRIKRASKPARRMSLDEDEADDEVVERVRR